VIEEDFEQVVGEGEGDRAVFLDNGFVRDGDDYHAGYY